MVFDYLVVGTGLTGAVIARRLHDAGRSVLVVDRRSHIGGNVHDFAHPSGIRIHTYGPHYFRTSSEKIWQFVTSFADFYTYEACLKSYVDGQVENWPIAGSYITRLFPQGWSPAFSGTPRNFEEASLATMPRAIYEKFIRGYTEKQWGVPARDLDAGLAGRFDVRYDDEPRLKRHRYQGLPLNGYAEFMNKMLRGIPVMLNVDYRTEQHELRPKKLLIYTGPIDEFFNYRLGKLKYRGQKRFHEYYPDVDYIQCTGQVNYPSQESGAHVRVLEWKHMMPPSYAGRIRGTVLSREEPFSPLDSADYEYPFPDQSNAELYARYRRDASQLSNVLICGRLGEYRYFDMDQAIGRAMMLVERILATTRLDACVELLAESSASVCDIDKLLKEKEAPHVR